MSTIPADSPNLLYSPATWRVTGEVATTINAGAYVRALLEGVTDSLSLTFDVSQLLTPLPRVSVRVDGGAWVTSQIAAVVPVAIPSGVEGGVHYVELVIDATTETRTRWGGVQTAVRFTGFTAPTTLTARPVQRRPLTGALFGDSITEGVRTLALDSNLGDVGRNSALVALAYPLTDALGAEVGAVGFGATGLTKGGNGGVPKFSELVTTMWSGQARPDLTTLDFVAAMVGTNDSNATDAQVTADATTFCNNLIGAVSATCAIVLIRPWLGKKAAAIQAGIAACSQPSRITWVDSTGWWNPADASDNLHPYGYSNLSNLVPRTAAAIQSALSSGEDEPSGAWIWLGDRWGSLAETTTA